MIFFWEVSFYFVGFFGFVWKIVRWCCFSSVGDDGGGVDGFGGCGRSGVDGGDGGGRVT